MNGARARSSLANWLPMAAGVLSGHPQIIPRPATGGDSLLYPPAVIISLPAALPQDSLVVLIVASIQVNIRAGNLPDPEDNGTAYLKIPLDTL